MTKPGVYVSSMEDFEDRFGPSPLGQMYVGLVSTNLPTRWHWLTDHPRLLRIAFFLRPSWQPDLNAYRVLATETAEIMERADAISTDVFAEFARQYPDFAERVAEIANAGQKMPFPREDED